MRAHGVKGRIVVHVQRYTVPLGKLWTLNFELWNVSVVNDTNTPYCTRSDIIQDGRRRPGSYLQYLSTSFTVTWRNFYAFMLIMHHARLALCRTWRRAGTHRRFTTWNAYGRQNRKMKERRRRFKTSSKRYGRKELERKCNAWQSKLEFPSKIWSLQSSHSTWCGCCVCVWVCVSESYKSRMFGGGTKLHDLTLCFPVATGVNHR